VNNKREESCKQGSSVKTFLKKKGSRVSTEPKRKKILYQDLEGSKDLRDLGNKIKSTKMKV